MWLSRSVTPTDRARGLRHPSPRVPRVTGSAFDGSTGSMNLTEQLGIGIPSRWDLLTQGRASVLSSTCSSITTAGGRSGAGVNPSGVTTWCRSLLRWQRHGFVSIIQYCADPRAVCPLSPQSALTAQSWVLLAFVYKGSSLHPLCSPSLLIFLATSAEAHGGYVVVMGTDPNQIANPE